jgi:hypothetical protein
MNGGYFIPKLTQKLSWIICPRSRRLILSWGLITAKFLSHRVWNRSFQLNNKHKKSLLFKSRGHKNQVRVPLRSHLPSYDLLNLFQTFMIIWSWNYIHSGEWPFEALIPLSTVYAAGSGDSFFLLFPSILIFKIIYTSGLFWEGVCYWTNRH